MKRLFAIAAAAAMMLAGVSAQAQTIYSQKNRHYRPQPGTVIGAPGTAVPGSGYHAHGFTRFSAIVEGGLACLIDNLEGYKSVTGNMSMSAGALVNETIFAGAMLKYSGAGAYNVDWSNASNCIIGADVRYYFPGYLIYPFVCAQVGGDIRKQSETEISVTHRYFYGGVKVGAKYDLSPFLALTFAAGVDNAGGITTIPLTIGLQF